MLRALHVLPILSSRESSCSASPRRRDMDDLETGAHLACGQIAKIANLNSTKIALSSDLSSLTYAELLCRSGALASHLVDLGVSSGQVVAICMERSVNWIVAALAIMRVGAAYVPLDCEWAPERVRYASKDSRASLVIGSRKLLEKFTLELPVLDIDDECWDSRRPFVCPCKSFLAEDLAYIIYTSGSTGVPKGVEITHANLAHLIRWQLGAVTLTSEDRVSHFAGLAFDAAVWEIWPALAAGSTIIIPDSKIRTSPELLKKWIVEKQVTVSYVPTILAMSMIRSEWPGHTSLRVLLTGGDTLLERPIQGLPFQVINNYGPTECTVVSTSGVVQASTHGFPSIGRPIEGTFIYLLDEERRKVPLGTIGEIYIGGNGVGRGYRNLPEVTQDVFVPDPFAPEVQNKRTMYRSGDLGVEHPAGDIEFKGRLDRQVKLRGFRIELDEISHVLNSHKSVAFATVLLANPNSCNAQLVAYIVAANHEVVITSRQMQDHLRPYLPEYMIPSVFVRLTSLPISRNGKIDISLLEPAAHSNLLPSDNAREPTTNVEKQVLEMMQKLLKCSRINIEDDFFLVGGHSLIGMQLILRIREEFGVDLSLRQIFQASTLSRLAAEIESQLLLPL